MFPRVLLRRTLSLSAPKTFANVSCRLEWISVHIVFIHNSLDFWFGSSKTFCKSLDFFAILSSRNYPYRKYTALTLPFFRVGYQKQWRRHGQKQIKFYRRVAVTEVQAAAGISVVMSLSRPTKLIGKPLSVRGFLTSFISSSNAALEEIVWRSQPIHSQTKYWL